MKIQESFEIAVPIDRMYNEINDIGEIGRCVAGVKQVTVLSETDSKWKIEARAGFMARTFDLEAKITDRRAPEYLAFAGQGQDLQMSGHLDLKSVSATTTQCSIEVDVTVTGPFASIVELMAKGPQQALIKATIANMRKKLETGNAPAAS